MVASYLVSPFQKSLLTQLRGMNRDKETFFAEAPLVIDCRDDAETFRNLLGDRQCTTIAKEYEIGSLKYVSQLAQPAYKYSRGRVEERHCQLDPAGLREVRSFLDNWRLEVGKRAEQPGKSRPNAFGIDIILPPIGARLSYDISSLVGL